MDSRKRLEIAVHGMALHGFPHIKHSRNFDEMEFAIEPYHPAMNGLADVDGLTTAVRRILATFPCQIADSTRGLGNPRLVCPPSGLVHRDAIRAAITPLYKAAQTATIHAVMGFPKQVINDADARVFQLALKGRDFTIEVTPEPNPFQLIEPLDTREAFELILFMQRFGLLQASVEIHRPNGAKNFQRGAKLTNVLLRSAAVDHPDLKHALQDAFTQLRTQNKEISHAAEL